LNEASDRHRSEGTALSIVTPERISEAEPAREPTPPPRPVRQAAGWALTALAAVVVFAALVAPDQHTRLTLGAFARIPVEGLAGAALLLLLPRRPRSIVAIIVGALLGVSVLIQVLDLGMWTFLNRQFDLVADWGLLDDGVAFLRDAVGRAGSIAAIVVAVLLVAAVPALMALSVLRLSRVAARHRSGTSGGVALLAAAWIATALLGTQLVPGVPVAARSQADLVRTRTLAVRDSLHDQKAFAAAVTTDRFRTTPGDQLLTALRGKDVVVSFVESYGRSALEDPQQAAIVGPALTAGERQLAAAGFSARSGFITSSTFGGYSWLAHATLQSGLLINGQQRYRGVVATDRLTLTGAFRRAGWGTVAVEPDNTYAWPEGAFYGYQQVYDARTLGYAGPQFGWSRMPDQYTLSAFQRLVYGKPHAPLMAEVTLTSSHTPWAPVPQLVDWKSIGDGAAVYGPQVRAGSSPESVWRDPRRVRTEYARSIAYSVSSLTSWAQTYGKGNLVLVFLGDHQAAPIVSGPNATHDVPVTIVARDPAVLDKVAGWGWQPGLKPDPAAPVMPMEAFRDRFLTTFR
jgi:hypothetical protein